MSRPVYVQEFPTPPTVGEVIELIGDEGRHAVSVKRTGVGEQIELVDGHGTRAVITVTGVSGKDRLTGVVDCVANEPAPRPTVTVIQALPKAARSELTVDLLTQAGADVIVPNSQLIANQVVNWTLSDHLRRIEIGLGVAYDSDPKQVIKLLTEVAREHADLLATPAPTAQFTDFGASALQFKLYAWTARSERMGAIRSELCIAIHERLKTEGIVLATS